MTTPLIQGMARLLLAPILVIAVAVLVKGYTVVGDGFAAGVIAAMAFLLQYLAFGYETTEQWFPFVRFAMPLALAGLLLALLVGFVPLLLGLPLLTHLPPPGAEVVHFGMLELHTSLLFDLGVFFLVLGFIVAVTRIVAQVHRRGPP